MSGVDEHSKLGKVMIEIKAGQEKHFGLSPTKVDIQIPADFLRSVDSFLKEPRAWGNIDKGKPQTFRQAARYRMDNEGKNAPKKKPKVPSSKDQDHFNPDSKVRKKPVKPNTRVVRSIEHDGNKTIVVIDNTAEKAGDLISHIRIWKD